MGGNIRKPSHPRTKREGRDWCWILDTAVAATVRELLSSRRGLRRANQPSQTWSQSRGEKQLSFTLFLASSFLTLCPVHQIVLETREQGRLLIQPTWVGCLNQTTDGEESRSECRRGSTQEAQSLAFLFHPYNNPERKILLSIFMQEEAEVQRCRVISPKSHS